LAKECGFTESSPEWIGVLNIIESEKAIIWFLKNGVEGMKQTIKAYANRV
jgi:RNA polymerase subunit RPABC4/transcription elongation factor Spt4